MNGDTTSRFVSGDCPVHHCKKTIKVDYTELSTCGNPTTSYGKVGCKCEDKTDSCNENPEGMCPIFSKLPLQTIF